MPALLLILVATVIVLGIWWLTTFSLMIPFSIRRNSSGIIINDKHKTYRLVFSSILCGVFLFQPLILVYLFNMSKDYWESFGVLGVMAIATIYHVFRLRSRLKRAQDNQSSE